MIMPKKEEKRLKISDLFNQQILKDKKITKASLIQGLNVLITKYPIDGTVLNICKNNFKELKELNLRGNEITDSLL